LHKGIQTRSRHQMCEGAADPEEHVVVETISEGFVQQAQVCIGAGSSLVPEMPRCARDPAEIRSSAGVGADLGFPLCRSLHERGLGYDQI
jgi:hypothetical protein